MSVGIFAQPRQGEKLQRSINDLLAVIDTGKPIKRISNTWSKLGHAFYLQCGMIVGTILCAITFLTPTVPNSTQGSTSQTLPKASPTTIPSKPAYVRPRLADNGAPFPTNSGYIDGYPVVFTDGYSTLTIDNSQNDSDVFVKLFSLAQVQPTPVRVFFIRSGDKFTVKDVRAGKYDVRYRNLDTGTLSRSDLIELEEFKTDSGVKFSRVTITLYKVFNGNMKTYPIAENEF